MKNKTSAIFLLVFFLILCSMAFFVKKQDSEKIKKRNLYYEKLNIIAARRCEQNGGLMYMSGLKTTYSTEELGFCVDGSIKHLRAE